jgi:hypothetical protein
VIDVKKLCEESWQIADEHGWHDRPRTLTAELVNIHAEISEAWEEVRNGVDLREIRHRADGKPEGFPTEMADILIRLGDTCHGRHCTDDVARLYAGMSPIVGADLDIEDRIALLHFAVAHTILRESDLAYNASDLVHVVEEFCEQLGIDLPAAVAEKHAFNRTRPYRHGNKTV